MSTPNKVAAFVCVDYADKHTNQDTRRCRCIAHTADLSALIDINPSYFLTCHPERNRVIPAIPARVMLSATKHLGSAREILRGVYTECNECAQDDTFLPLLSHH